MFELLHAFRWRSVPNPFGPFFLAQHIALFRECFDFDRPCQNGQGISRVVISLSAHVPILFFPEPRLYNVVERDVLVSRALSQVPEARWTCDGSLFHLIQVRRSSIPRPVALVSKYGFCDGHGDLTSNSCPSVSSQQCRLLHAAFLGFS